MTVPKPIDPLADLKERLEDAISDLERAAGEARDAIADLTEEPLTVPAVLHDSLLAAVRRWHEAEHDGPSRWCQHPVCREAQP